MEDLILDPVQPLLPVATPTDALAAGELTPTGQIPDEEPAPGAPQAAAADLPIGETSARRVTRWLMGHFGPQLTAAVAHLPFTPAHLCAIVCQETAYFWLPLLKRLEAEGTYANDPAALVDLILARCVLDAGGDHPSVPRSAFPVNTAAFRAAYGSEFTAMLIAEANATRALRGFQPHHWVYKGYGIFQYDLQYVKKDEAFFRDRRWRDFDACLAKCVGELESKLAAQHGDLWEAIRAYNGRGPRAERYRENVRTFTAWAQAEIDALPAAPAANVAAAAVPQPADIKPPARPALSAADLAARLAPFGIDRTLHPLVVVGIRGYYLDTMGQPGVNDRGLYDDALFLDAPGTFASFNGNTDPSRVRRGRGFADATKGMAVLQPGAWFAHRFDLHNGQYLALCQRLADVTVLRDGTPPYPDTGRFGINIHRGGYHGTSSLGCQTIHPDQWDAFITLAEKLARSFHAGAWRTTVIPYILLEA